MIYFKYGKVQRTKQMYHIYWNGKLISLYSEFKTKGLFDLKLKICTLMLNVLGICDGGGDFKM